MNVRAELDTFIHRICSLRSVTLLVAWICMLDITLGAFRDEAAALGVKDTFVVLPFVQTDMYFSKVILLGVLCFYSNAPFMEKGEMYAVLRTGRNRWGRRNIRYNKKCYKTLQDNILLAYLVIYFFQQFLPFTVLGILKQPDDCSGGHMEQCMGDGISYAFRNRQYDRRLYIRKNAYGVCSV